MPVRDKVVGRAVKELYGWTHFNNLKLTAYKGDQEYDGKVYDEDFNRIDKLWVSIIDSIDWNRVMLEATTRHIALDHSDPRVGACHECVQEALLACRTWQDWKNDAYAPRSRRCERCNGTGDLEHGPDTTGDPSVGSEDDWFLCPDCHGSGRLD